MNNILQLINALIIANDEYKDFRIVHTTNHEIRIMYKTFIIIVQYDVERIEFVNGFATLPKYIMDKLQCIDFSKQPWIKDHYHHHDSHEHHHHHLWDDYCKTIPACNYDDYRFNSDMIKRPHPDITLIHEGLDNYCNWIEQNAKDGRVVIAFINAIIDIRDNPGVERDPIYNVEKKNYVTKVENDLSQDAQNGKINSLETRRDNLEEVDPIWQAEKENYYTKDQFKEQQDTQDARITALEQLPFDEKDPIFQAEIQDYNTKDEVDKSQDIQDIRIKALEDLPPLQESDPIWNAEKGNYYKKDEVYSKKGIDDRLAEKANQKDLDTFAEGLESVINKNVEQDDTIRKLQDKVIPQFLCATKEIDNLEDTSIKIELDSKQIYSNSDIFKINEKDATIINNSDVEFSTNAIMISGVVLIQVSTTEANGTTNILLNCTGSNETGPGVDVTGVNTNLKLMIPFEFIVKGDTPDITLSLIILGNNKFTQRTVQTFGVNVRKLK